MKGHKNWEVGKEVLEPYRDSTAGDGRESEREEGKGGGGKRGKDQEGRNVCKNRSLGVMFR